MGSVCCGYLPSEEAKRTILPKFVSVKLKKHKSQKEE